MRGDLYWVDRDGDGSHVRPYLVMQSDVLNDVVATTVALPVTLAPQRAGPPLTIELDPGEAGLEPSTWIRVTQPQTLRLERFADRIGSLSPQRLQQTIAALQQVLDLDGHTPVSTPSLSSPSRPPRPS